MTPNVLDVFIVRLTVSTNGDPDYGLSFCSLMEMVSARRETGP
jgi:hypothetical protein